MDPTEPVKTIPISADPNIVSAPSIRREQEVVSENSGVHLSGPEIPVNLKEFGVDVIDSDRQTPNIPVDVQNAGVVHSGATIIPDLKPSHVNLPMTPQERKEARKGPKGDGRTWLANLLDKVDKIFRNPTKVEGGAA